MSQMLTEIGEAPAVVARVIANLPAIEAVAARLRHVAPRFVSVAARGSSSHAGTYLRVLIGRDLELAAAAAMPSSADSRCSRASTISVAESAADICRASSAMRRA